MENNPLESDRFKSALNQASACQGKNFKKNLEPVKRIGATAGRRIAPRRINEVAPKGVAAGTRYPEAGMVAVNR